MPSRTPTIPSSFDVNGIPAPAVEFDDPNCIRQRPRCLHLQLSFLATVARPWVERTSLYRRRSVSRTWLSIQVDLVEGHGEHLWPRPGRTFAAAHTHTFEQLADAIDDAFARWDRSHLQEFTLADKTRVAVPMPEWDDLDDVETLDIRRVKLSRLYPGEQFVYVFDLGDDWAHLCTVGHERIDPVETLGIVPDRPLPYWGWGDIPDQYRRGWDGDNGESPRPKDSKCNDLPPLRPDWGAAVPWRRS